MDVIKEWMAVAAAIVGAVVWLVRLEGRVNPHHRRHHSDGRRLHRGTDRASEIHLHGEMTMFLFVRMALYFVFAWLAGFGFGELDPAGSYFTVSLDQAAEIIVGVIGFIGTYIASRVAKARGGKT